MFACPLSTLLTLLLPLGQNPQNDDDARRQRMTPGLMIDTGARMADCDGLRFLPDGSELLAWGDDKVVRRFAVEGNVLSAKRLPPLRWPIYRESRGMIYAMDLAPNPDDDRVVVAGIGVNNSRVAIVERTSGETVMTLDPLAYPPGAYTNQAVWRARFSPDGKRVVLGDDWGQLFVWTPGDPAPGNVAMFVNSRGKGRNQILLIQFLDANEFLTVNEEGLIQAWNLALPAAPPRLVGKPFAKGRLSRAEISPDRKTLALLRTETDLIDLVDSISLLDLPSGTLTQVQVPNPDQFVREFISVAFAADGTRLAVGSREQIRKAFNPFHLTVGGKVALFERDAAGRFAPRHVLPCTNEPQQFAFHPKNRDLLVVAGGDDHELTMWNLADPKEPASVIRSPGKAIWGVGLSEDGKRLGFRTVRNSKASRPSLQAEGDWRVFDLTKGSFAQQGDEFRPVEPVLELKNPNWKVVPTPRPDLWNVVGPTGTVYPLAGALYNANYAGRPRCFTFVPANPKRKGVPNRLAVGHNWGVSVYDLTDNGPVLVRSFAGHEGPTTCIAPSRVRDVLVTGSRDQTVIGWSLVAWTEESPEMGGSFSVENGRLFVEQVAKGSPAWEVGLSVGDEIVGVTDLARATYFAAAPESLESLLKLFQIDPRAFQPARLDAAEQKKRLLNAAATNTVIFRWKRKTDGGFGQQLTSVRQRPMWRFFPTEKNEFVSWLWRDYYFDTNAAEPDRLAGWQVHDDFKNAPMRRGDDPTPVFHPLTSLADARQNPQKVRAAMTQSVADPDLESFSQVEPPRVTLRILKPRPDGGVEVELFGMANRKKLQAQDIQNLTRYELFVNDVLVKSAPVPGGEAFELKGEAAIPIEAKFFVRGRNRIRLNVYNKGDALGSDFKAHVFTPPEIGAKTLHFLGVGVTDYSKTKPPQNDLSGRGDATRVQDELCKPEEKARLYGRVNPVLLRDREVKVGAVLSKLDEMAKQVKSADDLFVLFLAGHGARFGQTKDKPGTKWYYLCHDTDINSAPTCLFGDELAAALEKIPCRKVVFLDACHSGSVTEDQFKAEASTATQSLTRRCDKVIFTACGPNEFAWERGNKGLFTDVLITALSEGGSPDRKTLTAIDIKNFVEKRVPEEFKRVQEQQRKIDPTSSILKQASQTPYTFRADLEPIELFSRAK